MNDFSNNFVGSFHPHGDADIPPCMPTDLHEHPSGVPKSPVAWECLRRGLSIHDRYEVYETLPTNPHAK